MKFWASTAFSPPEHYLPLARAADEAGVHGIMMSDHIFYPARSGVAVPVLADGAPIWPPETAWPDNWVTISAMAAVTERLQFGTSVYIAPRPRPVHGGQAGGDGRGAVEQPGEPRCRAPVGCARSSSRPARSTATGASGSTR